MLRSPRNSRTGLHPHTGPQITTTPRPRTASPSSPLNRPSLQTSAVARPRPNPHSKRPGTAQYVPSLAVSSLEGFQTPAAVRVGMFVTAGVWNPSQTRKSRSTIRHGSYREINCPPSLSLQSPMPSERGDGGNRRHRQREQQVEPGRGSIDHGVLVLADRGAGSLVTVRTGA